MGWAAVMVSVPQPLSQLFVPQPGLPCLALKVTTSFLVALPTEDEARGRGTQNQGNRNF
jgi:hypothetical protein